MQLFDRRCTVTIGPEGDSGLSFDQRFRISFRVIKSLSSETNAMNVQIYGLSQSTRDRVLTGDQILQIEAGYREGTEVLAVADVTRSVAQVRPPEIITTFDCQDGVKALRDRKIALSFAPDTQVSRVLDRIAQELALGDRATGAEVEGVYRNGVTISGTVREALDKVTRKAGVTWSIQDRELQILDRVESAQGRGVLLSPRTGLIDSPERLDDEEAQNERRAGSGYKVRSLLNPKIRPGDQLVLESATASGQFRIDRVEHVGDTRGEDWYTEAEVYAY